jgi:hypothetical protein
LIPASGIQDPQTAKRLPAVLAGFPEFGDDARRYDPFQRKIFILISGSQERIFHSSAFPA